MYIPNDTSYDGFNTAGYGPNNTHNGTANAGKDVCVREIGPEWMEHGTQAVLSKPIRVFATACARKGFSSLAMVTEGRRLGVTALVSGD